MTYPADFADAHRRHLEDAYLLFENAHWPNADHLYGLSVECGLKAIMLRLGMDVALRPEHKKHLPELWLLFEHFAREHDGSRYVDMLSEHERFADWSINNRYARSCKFQDENVDPHRDAARGVSEVVQYVAQERVA